MDSLLAGRKGQFCDFFQRQSRGAIAFILQSFGERERKVAQMVSFKTGGSRGARLRLSQNQERAEKEDHSCDFNKERKTRKTKSLDRKADVGWSEGK